MKTERRRRLADLYVRGEEVTLDDGQGDPVTVWLRKMSPVEAERAYAKASAHRARVLSMSREDPPSDTYVTLVSNIGELDHSSLVDWATSSEMATRRPIIEARIAYENEWMKDNYLTGLRDLVDSAEFLVKREEFPEDEEIVRVTSQLEKFEAEVNEEVDKEFAACREDYDVKEDEWLREHVIEEIIKIQADSTWLVEYRKCQVWLCTHDSEKKSQPYFTDRAEVDQLQGDVLVTLMEVCERLNVEELEGKGLPQIPVS